MDVVHHCSVLCPGASVDDAGKVTESLDVVTIAWDITMAHVSPIIVLLT